MTDFRRWLLASFLSVAGTACQKEHEPEPRGEPDRHQSNARVEDTLGLSVTAVARVVLSERHPLFDSPGQSQPTRELILLLLEGARAADVFRPTATGSSQLMLNRSPVLVLARSEDGTRSVVAAPDPGTQLTLSVLWRLQESPFVGNSENLAVEELQSARLRSFAQALRGNAPGVRLGDGKRATYPLIERPGRLSPSDLLPFAAQFLSEGASGVHGWSKPQ